MVLAADARCGQCDWPAGAGLPDGGTPAACGRVANGPQRAGPTEEALMARKSSRGLSEQERAERRRQDRERLQQAAQELLSSEGWAR